MEVRILFRGYRYARVTIRAFLRAVSPADRCGCRSRGVYGPGRWDERLNRIDPIYTPRFLHTRLMPVCK